jgi:hypothetical protein
MTAQDELILFTNILAQSPEGLSDPHLIAKFAKAKFQLHAMSSLADIQAQNNTVLPTPQVAGGTISPPPVSDTAQSDNGQIPMDNQPLVPPTQNG